MAILVSEDKVAGAILTAVVAAGVVQATSAVEEVVVETRLVVVAEGAQASRRVLVLSIRLDSKMGMG